MSTAATNLGPSFERVATKVGGCRFLSLSGTLNAQSGLEEISAPSGLTAKGRQAGSRLRSFRVHGDDFRVEGLRDGDCLLVDPACSLRPGLLVLVEVEGRRRLSRVPDREVTDPRCNVIGALVGIIRKQGFRRGRFTPVAVARREKGFEAMASAEPSFASVCRPVPKLTVLRSQLGMLESARADTTNPRLRRALRHEADRVRKQLQNEARSE